MQMLPLSEMKKFHKLKNRNLHPVYAQFFMKWQKVNEKQKTDNNRKGVFSNEFCEYPLILLYGKNFSQCSKKELKSHSKISVRAISKSTEGLL